MNMKSSSAKPKSSPGRTDDFPPPLMISFPRSKSSSNRGSRSRSNPMFVRKINNDVVNQEPSSPKVTCIGQVRAKTTTTTTGTTAVRRRTWHLKLKPRWFRRNVSVFRCGCCRKSENSRERKQIEANRIECEIGHAIVDDDNDVFVSESPPRNAFLLTRSRSAPFRSSSLANRFLESTIENEEEDSVGRKLGVVEETEGSVNGDIGKENGEDEGSINGVEEFIAKPVKLSRCKSEPARTGDKLFMSFTS